MDMSVERILEKPVETEGAGKIGRKSYDSGFYSGQVEGSLRSARTVVPYIVELVQPRSVADVGCGMAGWLKAYQENGVADVRGYDGAWVSPDALLIPAAHFVEVDLTQPTLPDRRFDLVQTLEVAEHFHETHADGFVEFLVRLSDAVVFAAAIPHQGGTHHVNEQWPDYWREKFEARGYVAFDPFRPRFWDNPDVEWWYAQNMFLFAHERVADRFSALPRTRQQPGWPERMIHPGLPASKDEIIDNLSLGRIVRGLPGAVKREFGRRLGGRR